MKHMIETCIRATVNGHPCVITTYEIGHEYRTVLGYETIGDPFPCPGCGVQHEVVDGIWTKVISHQELDEYGEAYNETRCVNCDAYFHAPMESKTYFSTGPKRRSLTLQCVRPEWVMNEHEIIVACVGRNEFSGKYLLQRFGGHTAELVRQP